MTPTNFEMVKEFHKSFNLPVPDEITMQDIDTISLRLKLIYEELNELHNEFSPKGNFYIKTVAKEIADLLYVTYGFAATLGIPIDKVFEEVHKSNMTKLGDDGKPVYRDDGKVLKSKNYLPPNLNSVLGLDK